MSPKYSKPLFISGNTYSIIVHPASSRNEYLVKDESVHIYLTSPAHNNKANEHLVKFFKKNFKCSIKIHKGQTAKTKTIMVL